MESVPIKTTCRACQGEGYWATGDSFELAGRKQHSMTPCSACRGTGKEIRWVDQQDFANMLTAINAEKQPA